MSRTATINLGVPDSEPQKRFLQSTARYVAYGGARGGGKTWAAIRKACEYSIQYKGYRVLIIRRTFPELRENIVKPLQEKTKAVAKFNRQEKTFYFLNGSQIITNYLRNDEDISNFQGHQYHMIIIEEATNHTERQFKELNACIRSVDGYPLQMCITCNPGGIGHHWVKRLFVDRRFREDERPEEYEFIPAKVYDNKVLMERNPEYLNSLKALPEKKRRAWLDGDWEALLEGTFFTEFSEEIHVVEPFEIPKHWSLVYGMDYGLDMLAAYIGAVDEAGRITIIEEIAEPELLIDQAAERVRQMVTPYLEQGYRLEYMAAPQDMWNRNRDTGRSLAEAFAERGLFLALGKNSRVMGWQEVLRYLHPEENGPRLKIFRTCEKLIESFPLLLHDEKNPDDVAGEPHEFTHGPDAIRIMLSLRPAASMPQEVQKAQEMRNEAESYDEFIDYGSDF